jgi:uncharacterized protein (DUF983 family)
MDPAKRAPTEMEVQLLLRNVARKAEDEATVDDYAHADRGFGPSFMVSTFASALIAGLLFAQESMRSWPGVVALLAWTIALAESVEVRRLRRVTKALARMAVRARAEEPLPRAPSPPTAATG